LQARTVMGHRYRALLKERDRVLKLFVDERPGVDPKQLEKPDPLDPKRKEKLEQFEAYRKRQTEYDKDDSALIEEEKVYLRHIKDMQELKDVRVVVCGLSWNDGLPVDGGSALTRLLDDTAVGPGSRAGP